MHSDLVKERNKKNVRTVESNKTLNNSFMKNMLFFFYNPYLRRIDGTNIIFILNEI